MSCQQFDAIASRKLLADGLVFHSPGCRCLVLQAYVLLTNPWTCHSVVCIPCIQFTVLITHSSPFLSGSQHQEFGNGSHQNSQTGSWYVTSLVRPVLWVISCMFCLPVCFVQYILKSLETIYCVCDTVNYYYQQQQASSRSSQQFQYQYQYWC